MDVVIDAAVYARVSTLVQAERGYSIPEQIEADLKHADKQRYRVRPEHIFKDAHTGEELDRPGLDSLRDLVQRGGVTVIICLDIDRLSRTGWQRKLIEMEFAEYGPRVEYVLGNYADSEEGNLHKDVISAFAEYENRKRVARSKSGKLGKTKSGRTVSSFSTYGYSLGYDANGKQQGFAINEDEAKIVRLVFQWYLYGDETRGPLAVRAIANRLTEMQVPNKKHRPEHGAYYWSHEVVHEMLEDETYTGTWYYNKSKRVKITRDGKKRSKQVPRDRNEWIAVPVPSIIPREAFDLVQQRFEVNKERSKRNVRHEYALRGMLRCGTCGKKFRGKRNNHNGRLYYHCIGHDRGHRSCPMPRFYEDVLEPVIWKWLVGLIQSPHKIREVLEAKQYEQEYVSLQQRLRLVEQQLEEKQVEYQRLLGLYLKGSVPEAMLDTHRGPLEKAITELEQERDRLSKYIDRVTYSPERINAIIDFCYAVHEGLQIIEDDDWTEQKQRIYDLLDVQATLAVEDGQQVAYAQCCINESRLPIYPLVYPSR